MIREEVSKRLSIPSGARESVVYGWVVCGFVCRS